MHIPTLLIVTFIIFVCIPDFVIFFIYSQLLKGTGIVYNIMAIFYRIAWLVDPAIYIYSSTLFRKTLFNRHIEILLQHKHKDLPESLFNKFVGLRPASLLKKRLWRKCFPVNFTKFLRTPFLQNTSGRLLLHCLR